MKKDKTLNKINKNYTNVGYMFKLGQLALYLILCCLISQTAFAATSSNSQGSSNNCHGTATFAGLSGEPPTYFFPMYQPQYWDTGYVPWASYLMWRPLYMWGKGNKPKFNQKRSLAKRPVFSKSKNGNTVATITLKNRKWSNGNPITTRDIKFWMNLLKANKKKWAPYVPHEFPDNVKSINYISKRKFKIVFNKSYSHIWLLANELDQITPIPQKSWDKISKSGPVKNYDTTKAGAKKVYKFLQNQAKTPKTFSSNPLWKVVDGPWIISSFNTTNSRMSFKPNSYYPWPHKEHLCKFTEKPFTSVTSEINALKTGNLTVGYVPLTSLGTIKSLKQNGYKIANWYQDAFGGLIINYAKNNTATPILKKLYIRKAMTHLTPMKIIKNKIFSGRAYYSSSPIPALNGHGAYVTKQDKHDPYPYNPKKAKTILRKHGWDVHPNSVTVCKKPGKGSGHCGSGIKKNAKLSFKTVGTSSSPTKLHLLELLKSSYSHAGIKLNLKTVPESQLPNDASSCSGTSTCSWNLELWMGEWPLGWTPYLEVGGNTFVCGASSNYLNLCNKKNNRLIQNIVTSNKPIKALKTWEDYMSKEQFQIYLPIPVYRVVAYKSNLKGVKPLDPYLQIFPEDWRYKK